MGCFNETDALSQIPIVHGDPVKLFVLRINPISGAFCGCEEPATVLSLPISGTYDDYGCIENIVEDWSTKAFLMYANNELQRGAWRLAVRAEKLAKFEMPLCKYPYENIQDLLKAIKNGYLIVYDTRSTEMLEWIKKHCPPEHVDKLDKIGASDSEHSIGLMMINDPIYEVALKLGDFNIGGGYADKIRAKINSFIAQANSEENTEELVWRSDLTDIFRMTCGNELENVYGSHFIVKDNRAIVPQIIERLIDFTRLYVFMQQTRKFFFPQSGAGSQCAQFDLIATFLRFASEYAEARQKKQEEHES